MYRSGTSRGIPTTIGGSSGSTYKDGLSIDASLSSPVYGTQTADAVQPRGVQVLIYIVIANTVKTPVQVDIDNIATQMNLVTSRTNEMYPHRLVEFQLPTADNNYTWYRKYADGWVEQGGVSVAQTVSAGYGSDQTITLLVPMADTNYGYAFGSIGAWASRWVSNVTTTSFVLTQGNRSGGGSNSQQTKWRVEGVAAS